MRVIVTRPEHEALLWAQRLRAHGIDAVALPLIAIGDAPDAATLRSAWAHLSANLAVMFVSGNAVHGFWRGAPEGAKWPLGVRAWAPGPGTGQALLERGVPQAALDAPAEDAAQFDSEALWLRVRVQAQAGARVLMVRGADAQGAGRGRDWMGEQLTAAGVTVDHVLAYRRQLPAWTEHERRLAKEAAAEPSALWLFSSSEGIANLARLLPGQRWHAARALVTHPRIGQAAQAQGFGTVLTTRPAFDAVVASIESAR